MFAKEGALCPEIHSSMWETIYDFRIIKYKVTIYNNQLQTYPFAN